MALPNKVNIGTAPGNGTGDPARTAFDKLNNRDEYLETNKADKSELTGFETPAGAQAKADAAEASANAYTDGLIDGVKWKNAVDLLATTNVVLSGEQTIDGTLTSTSRVGVIGNNDATENGIYITSSGAWTRATDADTGDELLAATFKVINGSHAGEEYTNNNTSITLGTTEVTFAFRGSSTAHNSTSGKQGGATNEYYHLTLAQLEKLNGLEAGATADMSGAEIKQLYEAQPNTNAFTDIRRDKVDGLPASVEPAFNKNDAFNKTFGIVADTVAQGNDSRILNGQTAYEWGNHANAGYALSSEVNTSSPSEAGESIFFLEDAASDVTGYKVMANPAELLSESYVVETNIVDGQVMQEWITNVGKPKATFIPSGPWRMHMNAFKTGGSAEIRLYQEHYLYENGVEVLKATTADSIPLTETEVSLPTFDEYVEGFSLADTDRIVTKTLIRVIGGGSLPTSITIGYSGSTGARLSIPSQGIDPNDFVKQTEFDTLDAEVVAIEGRVATNENNIPEATGALSVKSINYNFDNSTFLDSVKAGASKVVFVGTSITEGVVAQAEAPNIWVNQFMRAIQDKYNDINFTPVNFGLSSRQLSRYILPTFQGVASEPINPNDGFYREKGVDAWQTPSVVGKSWKDHCKDEQPDLFLIHFGMNDTESDSFYKDALQTAIDDAKSWAKVPSIVLVTEMLPISSDVSKNLRMEAYARITRELAVKNGCGLIDVNRQWRLLRDGEDELNISYQRTGINLWDLEAGNLPTARTYNSISHSATSIVRTIGEKYIEASYSFDFVLNASDSNVSGGLRFQELEGWTSANAYIISASAVKFYQGGSVKTTFPYTFNLGTTYRAKILFGVSGFTVFINDVFLGEYKTELFYKRGDAAIGLSNASITNLECDLGTPKKVILPRFPNNELVGTLTASDWNAGDYSQGGNGINHPSRIGLNYGFKPAIHDFTSSLKNEGISKSDIFDEANTFSVSPSTPPATQPDHVAQWGQVQDERVVIDVSGTYDLDWTKEILVINMTADTTFSDINLPQGAYGKLMTIYLTGDFIPTFPIYWDVDNTDAYVGTGRNRIVVDCINGNAASEDVTYQIQNL